MSYRVKGLQVIGPLIIALCKETKLHQSLADLPSKRVERCLMTAFTGFSDLEVSTEDFSDSKCVLMAGGSAISLVTILAPILALQNTKLQFTMPIIFFCNSRSFILEGMITRFGIHALLDGVCCIPPCPPRAPSGFSRG